MCVRVPLPPRSYFLGRHPSHDSLSRGHSRCRGLAACAHNLGTGVLSCPAHSMGRTCGGEDMLLHLGSGTSDNPSTFPSLTSLSWWGAQETDPAFLPKNSFSHVPATLHPHYSQREAWALRWGRLCPRGLWPLVIGRAGIWLCPFSPDVAFRCGLVQGTCRLAGGPGCVGILVLPLPCEVGEQDGPWACRLPDGSLATAPGLGRPAHGRGSRRSGLLCSH